MEDNMRQTEARDASAKPAKAKAESSYGDTTYI